MSCVKPQETIKSYFYIISYFSHNKYRIIKVGYASQWNRSKRMRKLKQLLPCFKLELYQNLSRNDEKMVQFVEKLKPFQVRKNLYRHPITEQELHTPFYDQILESIFGCNELERLRIREYKKCNCALSDKFSCDAPDLHKKWLDD